MYPKKETSNKEMVLTILSTLIVIAIVVGLLGYMVIQLRDSFVDLASTMAYEREMEALCISNGYGDYEQVKEDGEWVYYCIGVLNGTTHTTPALDLIRE